MHPFHRRDGAQHGRVIGIGPLLGRPAPDMIERVENLGPIEYLVADDLPLIELERVALEGLTNLFTDQFQLAAIACRFGIFIIRGVALV